MSQYTKKKRFNFIFILNILQINKKYWACFAFFQNIVLTHNDKIDLEKYLI
jgi:hypothetical protein